MVGIGITADLFPLIIHETDEPWVYGSLGLGFGKINPKKKARLIKIFRFITCPVIITN